MPYCPICENYSERFLPKNGREGVVCPYCGSFERHRHQWLVYKIERLDLQIWGKKILHCSPSTCLKDKLSRVCEYYSIDKFKINVGIRADLCYLPFRDKFFDFIWCSHVLEHIEDVTKALKEIKRVLKSNSIVLLDVPIYGKTTQKFTEPKEFGHYWAPGLNDWFDFYTNAGFEIKKYSVNLFNKTKYGLNNRGPVVLAKLKE